LAQISCTVSATGAALDTAFFDFVGTAVDDFPPLRFGIIVNDIVKTGDQMMCKESPVLHRQRQHFGYLFSGNAHIQQLTAPCD
jgi:hypothetical protein